MFLFNKKTRNVVKAFWAVFATLIIVSMVIAYSGFTSLPVASNPEQSAIDLAPEEVTRLRESNEWSASSSSANAGTADASEAPLAPPTPPVQQLKFDI